MSIPSAGATEGWTYYGLLLSRSGAEQWQDLNFDPAVGAPASRKPVINAVVTTTSVTMNIRKDKVVVQPDGTVKYPPIVGILGVGTKVVIREVQELPSNQGTHYWIRLTIQK